MKLVFALCLAVAGLPTLCLGLFIKKRQYGEIVKALRRIILKKYPKVLEYRNKNVLFYLFSKKYQTPLGLKDKSPFPISRNEAYFTQFLELLFFQKLSRK
jgi:hypothetical protein